MRAGLRALPMPEARLVDDPDQHELPMHGGVEMRGESRPAPARPPRHQSPRPPAAGPAANTPAERAGSVAAEPEHACSTRPSCHETGEGQHTIKLSVRHSLKMMGTDLLDDSRQAAGASRVRVSGRSTTRDRRRALGHRGRCHRASPREAGASASEPTAGAARDRAEPSDRVSTPGSTARERSDRASTPTGHHRDRSTAVCTPPGRQPDLSKTNSRQPREPPRPRKRGVDTPPARSARSRAGGRGRRIEVAAVQTRRRGAVFAYALIRAGCRIKFSTARVISGGCGGRDREGADVLSALRVRRPPPRGARSRLRDPRRRGGRPPVGTIHSRRRVPVTSPRPLPP